MKGKIKINVSQLLGIFHQQTSKLPSVLCINKDGGQTRVQVQSFI